MIQNGASIRALSHINEDKSLNIGIEKHSYFYCSGSGYWEGWSVGQARYSESWTLNSDKITDMYQAKLISIQYPKKIAQVPADLYEPEIGDTFLLSDKSLWLAAMPGNSASIIATSAHNFELKTFESQEVWTSTKSGIRILLAKEEIFLVDGPKFLKEFLDKDAQSETVVQHKCNSNNEICYFCGESTQALNWGFPGCTARICPSCNI